MTTSRTSHRDGERSSRTAVSADYFKPVSARPMEQTQSHRVRSPPLKSRSIGSTMFSQGFAHFCPVPSRLGVIAQALLPVASTGNRVDSVEPGPFDTSMGVAWQPARLQLLEGVPERVSWMLRDRREAEPCRLPTSRRRGGWSRAVSVARPRAVRKCQDGRSGRLHPGRICRG